jgi:transcriptional regulator with XRE-family HTH domain
MLRKSLEDVATAVGMSKSGVGHIETGENSTSTDTLVKLAGALDSRWIVRLAPRERPERSEAARELVDKIDQIADLLQDHEARLILAQLEIYENLRGSQGQSKT